MPATTTHQPLAPGAPERPGSPIVLVVDDDAEAGENTATDLRRAGLRVRTALTAEYALDFCRTQRFDAVVIDHHTADEYSEVVLDEAPDTGPAVIVSTATPPVLADIESRHADKVFAVKIRPVAPSELIEVVQEAVAASYLPRTP